MTACFADTAYFIALLSPADEFHDEAMALNESLRRDIITTTWVLVEIGDAMVLPRNRQLFLDLIKILDSKREIKVIPASSDSFAAGLDLFRQRPDKEWSLTDCISFAMMSQFNLNEVLTTDHHFAQAGFRLLMRSDRV